MLLSIRDGCSGGSTNNERGRIGRKGKGKVQPVLKKGSKKVSVTCAELERAFQEYKIKDDAFKLGLLYSSKGVLIGAKSNAVVNLQYLEFIHDIDKFNNYSWGAISFEQLEDSLSFAASRKGRGRVDGDVEEDDEEKEEEGIRRKRPERSR
ncbi:hypothetical protein D8674_003880 [Pyrus ussuriensis x Pyrus communis]|uniref:DUF1985 domain-containing protein n=1 Tax=Pyrus ussuriensis x Pyrus communis TaxID=2448454 RepID=A0A5N5FIA7_9ROSA|nr:hypothetical protein D8674_003880 [Pyrus ussuriensis x Pyrus communis]